MSTSSTSPPLHIAGLDGLRAIAVAVVVLFHLTPGALPGGYIGVDIFFVISGFLITGLLVREREASGGIRLGAFWKRRARRLLPALGLLILVCGTAAGVVGGDVLLHLGRQILGAASFSSNWLAIATGQSYFGSTVPDLFRNLWSLAVEEQFYLVWPLVILGLSLIPSRKVRAIIIAIMAIASALAMAVLAIPGADVTRVYYGTDTHSFGLAIGALLAVIGSRTRGKRVLVIAGTAALVALLAASLLLAAENPFTYRGGLVAVALLTAVVIAGATVDGSRLGRVLDVGALRWVGRRSYGLYLWHWPVYVLVVAALPAWDRVGAGGWLLGGIALVITVAASALSFRFVEQPVRRNGFRATARRWFGGWRSGVPRLLASGVVCIVLLGMLAATATAVVRDPGEGVAQAAIEKGGEAIRPAPAAPLAPVTLPGGDQITAIGDSVMLASAPELQAAFPGISIDAVVSRQGASAPGIVQAMVDSGTLRPTLLLGLGTNGPVDPAILARLLSIVGPRHQIVVVNVQAPRGWVDGVNSELTTFAQAYRNVELANWKDAIAGQLGLLARDQIHPGSRGGLVYVQAVTEALQRLAELPPRLGPNDYGLSPVPV